MGRVIAEVIVFAIIFAIVIFGAGRLMYYLAKREAEKHVGIKLASLEKENKQLRAELEQEQHDTAQLNAMGDEILSYMAQSPGLFDLSTVNERISNIIRAGRPTRK